LTPGSPPSSPMKPWSGSETVSAEVRTTRAIPNGTQRDAADREAVAV
jgi:hypothetical protein